MPATDKAGLLAVSAKEYAKLEKLIEGVDEDVALAKDADDTSIKDVVAHRAHWIDLFLGWHAEGQAGRTPEMPAPGYKWNQLKAYNADLRAAQADLGWDAARAMLSEAHGKLTGFLAAQTEDALYGGPMEGGGNAWTTGRWAEAAGPSHYRSATKYTRARLREG